MAKKTLTIPLFPLQDTVLFPHTYLPLHIFEPRYKEMVSDALEGDRQIGIVQLKPGWEENYYGNPAIYRYLGIGEIIDFNEYEDGRYDLVLQGMHRAHILSESVKGEYRQATVEVLSDTILPEEEEEVALLHRYFQKYLAELVNVLPDGYSLIPGNNIQTLSPSVLVDVFGAMIVDDPYERQSILAEPSVLRRQQLLGVQIKQMFAIQEFSDDPEQ